jgi:AcrR family transcriptional regulator
MSACAKNQEGVAKVRARFTTEEIAAAALRIVDDAGVAALSMRALAAALGTGPMTMYNYVPDKEGLEELVVAAVVAEVAVPEPTENWVDDVYVVADAMWRGIRAHPAAIPLVLTRRTSSATGFAAADALIAALARGGLKDSDRLAAFHAVLAFVVGAAQSELAGPLTRGRDAPEAAARIAGVAGASYPHVEALSRVAMKTSVEADFARGLQMLLDGIGTRGVRSRRRR